MSEPFPEDVLVAQFWNRCANALSAQDPEVAFQLLRDMQACEHRLFLTVCPPQVASAPKLSAKAETMSGKAAFAGRPLKAKFAGRCAVCGLGFSVGAQIFYNGDQKRAAHETCGEADE